MLSFLRPLLGQAAGIAASHLELWALTLERELASLARLWIHAAVTLFLLFTGTLLGVGWLVLWADPSDRLAIIGALALGFLGAGVAAAWSWRSLVRLRRPLTEAVTAWRGGPRSGPGSSGAPTPENPVRSAPPGPWSP